MAERLRRHDAVICQASDVSGFEDLVPEGVRSFVVATGPNQESGLGVLVVGWDIPDPPCDEAAVPHLRVAAALLQRALTDPDVEQRSLTDAILGSLADRIAVIDKNGVVVAVNAAWTAFALKQAQYAEELCGVGTNYLEVCRRAAASGALQPASILEGIEALVRRDSDSVQTAYLCPGLGDERWCVMTVTPLAHASGGAVVAHARMTPERIIGMGQQIGEQLFHRLVDAIPLPMWIVTPEGRLLHGNTLWMNLSNGDAGGTAEHYAWTAAFHPDDRARAISIFRAGCADRTPVDLELRLRMADDTYRWSACVIAPHLAADGRVERYVGFCCDISAKRRAESALTETASKLVAAQEAERSRISRELHDDLGQRAALLAAKLETLTRHPRMPADLRAGVVDAQDSVQELAVAIHSLSHQLHPARLKLLGLVKTLEGLCREVSKENGIKVHFKADGIPPNVHEGIALCAYRVAQEALQNAVKHSAARDVDVRLTATASRLLLRVKDKGRGFDPLTSHATGIGLLTMRERVELSGGQLSIQAAAARGTTIEATLPLADNSDRP